MTITLRIDRIVLDGAGPVLAGPVLAGPASGGDLADLRESLLRELSVVFTRSPVPSRSRHRGLVTGDAVACPSAPAALGRSIALSIHGALREGPLR